MLITAPDQALLYRRPAVFAPFAELTVAESTRHGGVSPVPFESLNLGLNTADDPAHVAENRRRFFGALGADVNQVASAHQIHGTAVLYARRPGRYDGYDALITDQPGLLVGVTVADCVPILIYDAAHRAVAAIHAGWRGTAEGIVQKALAAMQQQFGLSPDACYAYVGTCIDQRAFVVGPDVAVQFAPAFQRIRPETGQTCVDLKQANVGQLVALGIPPAQIGVSPYSTVEDNRDYFSHRAEGGQTGRMLAVIGLPNLT